ncbi:MAG: DUF4442 domain-containing protein [Flammeovirgaceae bacterium]|nr:DUF4442 domain-containing protein [Flammeovirgaceae bacterium]
MLNPATIIERAKISSLYRSILNWSVDRMVPFNKPHGFKILEFGDDFITTRIPYQKRNFNHIRGLHACALATLSEFTTGFLLLQKLDISKYRLIMKRLEMDYHYQGKMDATAKFRISNDWIDEKIVNPLLHDEAVVVICEVKIHDRAGNHLTTGQVHWQIKNWEKVKTKIVS